MTIAGFKSTNHPQQVRRRGADDATDDRRTPAGLFADLHAIHRFTLDAAASDENALLPEYFTRERCGLTHAWSGRVWCNPPYSALSAWVEKGRREIEDGNCELVVMLMPANRTEQGFWQEHIEPWRDTGRYPPGLIPNATRRVRVRTRFLSGRLRFGRPDAVISAKGDRPPFGCVLVMWERGGTLEVAR